MNGWPLGEVATAMGGVLGGGADPTALVTDVSIDSRGVGAGALFVALSGENVDGHDYAAGAVRAGAVAAVVSRPLPIPHLLVDDPTTALGALAAAYRNTLSARVTGVTGSVGKTSTKDLLAALLSAQGPTVAPPGNYNNDLGLPLTVLRADADTAHLVVEMGARARGDIARLCAIAAPHTAVVLNVGTAHLGEFGSRAAIATAKGELVEAASELAVLNADDPLVMSMEPRAAADVRTFGAGGQVRAEGLVLDDGGRPAFRLVAPEGSVPVRMLLIGAHQVPNALAAATVALAAGLSPEVVGARLNRAVPVSHWRMEVTERGDGVTVVNDAYNANPESARAALDALGAMTSSRRRPWAVLGEMLELGPQAPTAHADLGAYALSQGITHVIGVGEAARVLVAAAGPDAVWVPDREAALALLRGALGTGDVVLVKASRGAGLERLVAALLEDAPVSTGGQSR